MQDSNQPTQLQRLARMLKFCVEQVYQLYFPGSEQQKNVRPDPGPNCLKGILACKGLAQK